MRNFVALALCSVFLFSAPALALADAKKSVSVKKKAIKPQWKLAVRNGGIVLQKIVLRRNGTCTVTRTGSNVWHAHLDTTNANTANITYITKAPWNSTTNSYAIMTEEIRTFNDVAGVMIGLVCGSAPKQGAKLLPTPKLKKTAKK